MLNCWYTRTVEFETGVSLVGLFGSFAELAGLLIHHRAENISSHPDSQTGGQSYLVSTLLGSTW